MAVYILSPIPIPYSLDLQQAPLAVYDSLSVEVNQAFIPEGSGPLAVLPVLGSCSLPLTLIARQGNTPKCPRGSPFQAYSLPLCVLAVQFPLHS